MCMYECISLYILEILYSIICRTKIENANYNMQIVPASISLPVHVHIIVNNEKCSPLELRVLYIYNVYEYNYILWTL